MSSTAAEGIKAYEANKSVLSEEHRKYGDLLISLDQAHLFAHWPAPGEKDAEKQKFLEQVKVVETELVGGLKGYCERAKKLLAAARDAANPYEGYSVEPPKEFVRLESSADFDKYESLGAAEFRNVSFVMVAGGLGERLGYKGIKISLPSEISTDTSFIELFIRFILAFQARARAAANDNTITLPLGIMTSDDTDKLTREILEQHNNFGMAPDQIVIFKQGKVPSMVDNDAHFCLEESNSFVLDTKPHGHGDVHSLLYQHKIIEKWVQQGKKHVVFFQDTNGLVFRAIPAAIGVSVSRNLVINTVAAPRVAGDAVGAICTLTKQQSPEHKQGDDDWPNPLTINVEYNQLEGLLGKGVKEELVPGTNYAVLPGNTNVLIFNAPHYLSVLEKKKGIISEFVNPKYKPGTNNSQFKKPTRLECMMQEFPKLLDNEAGRRVGFCQFEKWTCYSAVKNALLDGVDKQKSGNSPDTGATGEADMYFWPGRILKEGGVAVGDVVPHSYRGIRVEIGSKIVLYPSVGVTQSEVKSKFVGGANVKIPTDCTLIVDGKDIVFHSLDLQGALIIRAVSGARVKVNNLTIKNKGWEFVEISDDTGIEQKYTVRGFTCQRHETAEFVFNEPKEYELSDSTKEQFLKH